MQGSFLCNSIISFRLEASSKDYKYFYQTCSQLPPALCGTDGVSVSKFSTYGQSSGLGFLYISYGYRLYISSIIWACLPIYQLWLQVVHMVNHLGLASYISVMVTGCTYGQSSGLVFLYISYGDRLLHLPIIKITKFFLPLFFICFLSRL